LNRSGVKIIVNGVARLAARQKHFHQERSGRRPRKYRRYREHLSEAVNGMNTYLLHVVDKGHHIGGLHGVHIVDANPHIRPSAMKAHLREDAVRHRNEREQPQGSQQVFEQAASILGWRSIVDLRYEARKLVQLSLLGRRVVTFSQELT
jgi:hypothetical protein